MASPAAHPLRILQSGSNVEHDGQSQPLISVVIPVYRAARIVDPLVLRLVDALNHITAVYEVILVDDGSQDDSWAAIERRCAEDERLKGIKLSRNFGQHSAITAGLEASRGQWVVVMDCDLQDQPEELGHLYAKALTGYDIVFGRRAERTDGWIKKLSSRAFFATLGYLTDTKQDPTIGNFGIYNRKVIAAILEMDDYVKFFPTMVKWVGFDATAIDVQHGQRFEGKTTYSVKSLYDLAINIILSFSDKPLRLTVRFGLLISLSAFLFATVNVYLYLTGQITVMGFTTLIVSLWLLSGIVITLIGMLGLYIGRIFDQTKRRPIYIVNKRLNES
jgi:dolichol-phosphate mannosyltransferase